MNPPINPIHDLSPTLPSINLREPLLPFHHAQLNTYPTITQLQDSSTQTHPYITLQTTTTLHTHYADTIAAITADLPHHLFPSLLLPSLLFPSVVLTETHNISGETVIYTYIITTLPLSKSTSGKPTYRTIEIVTATTITTSTTFTTHLPQPLSPIGSAFDFGDSSACSSGEAAVGYASLLHTQAVTDSQNLLKEDRLVTL